MNEVFVRSLYGPMLLNVSEEPMKFTSNGGRLEFTGDCELWLDGEKCYTIDQGRTLSIDTRPNQVLEIRPIPKPPEPPVNPEIERIREALGALETNAERLEAISSICARCGADHRQLACSCYMED